MTTSAITGLHVEDIKKLLLGPEGGAAGGQIVAEGRPEQVAKVAASYTGQFLAQALECR